MKGKWGVQGDASEMGMVTGGQFLGPRVLRVTFAPSFFLPENFLLVR